MSRKYVYVITLVMAILLTQGCGSLAYKDNNEKVLEFTIKAPIPDFRAGDSFTFDNGVTHKVVRQAGNRVDWAIGDKFHYSTSRNILYPWISWSTDKSEARGKVADPQALWPLQVGVKDRLNLANEYYKTKGGEPLKYTDARNCEVLNLVSITVPAGTYDAFKIQCYKSVVYEASRSSTGVNIYYYSPEVGYFVKEIELADLYADPKKIKQLSSYSVSLSALADADKKSLSKAFQVTMSTKLSDEKTIWRSSDNKHHIEITPTATYVQDDKTLCRSYTQVLNIDMRERKISGYSCRNPSGVWVQ